MTEHAEVEIVRHFDPVMLPPSATVMMAARHMHRHHVSAVLVTEGDAKLIGIFTERDAISRVLAEGKDPVATTLAEVMTDNPETITPRTTAIELVRLMQVAHCRHLPIVDEGKAVGMASRGKFRVIDSQLKTTSSASGGRGNNGAAPVTIATLSSDLPRLDPPVERPCANRDRAPLHAGLVQDRLLRS